MSPAGILLLLLRSNEREEGRKKKKRRKKGRKDVTCGLAPSLFLRRGKKEGGKKIKRGEGKKQEKVEYSHIVSAESDYPSSIYLTEGDGESTI